MEAPLQRLFMLRYSRQRCPSAISFAASEYLELPPARRENCASCSAVQACPNEHFLRSSEQRCQELKKGMSVRITMAPSSYVV